MIVFQTIIVIVFMAIMTRAAAFLGKKRWEPLEQFIINKFIKITFFWGFIDDLSKGHWEMEKTHANGYSNESAGYPK